MGDSLAVLKTTSDVGGVPVCFNQRRSPMDRMHTTLVAINSFPRGEEVAEGYAVPPPKEIRDALVDLRHGRVSAGEGRVSFYCHREVVDSEKGSEWLAMDPEGAWIGYDISAVGGAVGGLVVRDGKAVGIHVGVGGLKGGKVWEGSFGLGLAVDTPEVRAFLAKYMYMVDS